MFAQNSLIIKIRCLCITLLRPEDGASMAMGLCARAHLGTTLNPALCAGEGHDEDNLTERKRQRGDL